MFDKRKRTDFLSPYLELCKIRISLFAVLSACTGFILTGSEMAIEMVSTMMGVLFLACGACALNQYQERQTDALMDRTKNRPLPAGKIRPLHALYVSLFLLLGGFISLSLTGGSVLFSLGIFAVIWYNGFYTWVKRKSAFAAVPGALIGAVPPAIGWIAGGGSMGDQKIAVICFIFFIWQVPHFWLLLLSTGADYKKAGIPSLHNIFTGKQISRITFIWNTAAAVACLLIPLYGVSSSMMVSACLVAAALWLVWNGTKIIRQKGNTYNYPFLFDRINVYILIVMLLINIEKMVYAII